MDTKQRIIEALEIYKRIDLKVFKLSGLIFTSILIIIFLPFYLVKGVNFKLSGGATIPITTFDPIGLLLAFVIPIITMIVWWFLGTTYAPKLGALLTEKKIMNILITKGDIHYFEKVELHELRITPGVVISKFINLILAWFAVTAFLLGFLLQFFSSSATKSKIITFFTTEWNSGPVYLFDYFLKIIIIYILAPLLMSITIPIPWMLIDTRLKAYSSGTKTNSFVGRAVQARLSPLFAIGGILTLVMQNLSLETLVGVIIFILAILALPSIIMVTLYNMLFQVKYYESFLKEIPVPFGTTSVQMETKFQKQDEPQSQDQDKPDSPDSDESSQV